MSQHASIVDGPRLELKRAVEIDMPCPKCGKDVRVTSVAAGAVIKCPHSRCGNVTWRPEYVPPWWARTRNFLFSIIGSFILGLAASFVASALYEEYAKSRDAVVKPDPTTIPQP
jgi:hypothetical protein